MDSVLVPIQVQKNLISLQSLIKIHDITKNNCKYSRTIFFFQILQTNNVFIRLKKRFPFQSVYFTGKIQIRCPFPSANTGKSIDNPEKKSGLSRVLEFNVKNFASVDQLLINFKVLLPPAAKKRRN